MRQRPIILLTRLVLVCTLILLPACRNSLDDRAEQEARDYTTKFCPTPVYNYSRTDSLTFDRASRTFIYHCSLIGLMDSMEIISQHRQELSEGLLKAISASTQLKKYKDAGYNFRYLVHSSKNPQQVLFDKTYTQKDY